VSTSRAPSLVRAGHVFDWWQHPSTGLTAGVRHAAAGGQDNRSDSATPGCVCVGVCRYTTKSLLGALGVAGKYSGEASAAINCEWEMCQAAL
jgi:hypothetical protein